MGLTVTQLLRLRRFESCSPHVFLMLQIQNLIFKFAPVTNIFGNKIAEVAQLVERQPSKLNVAGSTPVFRSTKITNLFWNVIFFYPSRHSSGVERFLGKEEVVSSNLIVGSLSKPLLQRFFLLSVSIIISYYRLFTKTIVAQLTSCQKMFAF